jgi:FtsH-binding integral membrane protein
MIVILLAIVANIFLQMPGLHLAISAAIVLISAAWMLYDIQRIVRGGETNYVSASLSVYLNLYNMFVSLLNLLMALTGQRE